MKFAVYDCILRYAYTRLRISKRVTKDQFAIAAQEKPQYFKEMYDQTESAF